VDFAFEVEKVFVGVASVVMSETESSSSSSHENRHYRNRRHRNRRYNEHDRTQQHHLKNDAEYNGGMLEYQYFEVSRDGSVWWVEDRILGSIDKVTHSHTIIVDEGHVVADATVSEDNGKQYNAGLSTQQVLEDMVSCEMAVFTHFWLFCSLDPSKQWSCLQLL